MKRFMLKMSSCVCALVVVAGVVAGCGQGASPVNAEQQANRAYMSQVNGIMDELGVELDSFVDAVSRGDVVNMRTQADNAYKTLDELNGLDVPEALSDIQNSYKDGTSKLREALDDYIDLYAEAAASGSDLDRAAFDKRVKDIQSLYNEGVAALEEGDKAAAEAK